MKALILNSGIGSRMNNLTKDIPKCMLEIKKDESILSRQLVALKRAGIHDIVITTGLFDKKIRKYCEYLNLGLNYIFCNNPKYNETNYIYSIYLAQQYLQDDILLLHGDLVFDGDIICNMLKKEHSSMAVSYLQRLPEKDFKAVLKLPLSNQHSNRIEKIGVQYFGNAVAAQPLYFIYHLEWRQWLNEICKYCEAGIVNVYAEEALNRITHECLISPFDVGNALCAEIDTVEDLYAMRERLR